VHPRYIYYWNVIIIIKDFHLFLIQFINYIEQFSGIQTDNQATTKSKMKSAINMPLENFIDSFNLYTSKSTRSIDSNVQLVTQHYESTNSLKSTSAIKLVTKKTMHFYINRSHHVLTTKLTLFAVNGKQWRTLVSPRRMHNI